MRIWNSGSEKRRLPAAEHEAILAGPAAPCSPAWTGVGPPIRQAGTRVRAVSTIHTMNSQELIAELKAHGWALDRVSGSHHMFKHAIKPGTVVVPHPKKDLGKGLVNAIRKQAGLK